MSKKPTLIICGAEFVGVGVWGGKQLDVFLWAVRWVGDWGGMREWGPCCGRDNFWGTLGNERVCGDNIVGVNGEWCGAVSFTSGPILVPETGGDLDGWFLVGVLEEGWGGSGETLGRCGVGIGGCCVLGGNYEVWMRAHIHGLWRTKMTWRFYCPWAEWVCEEGTGWKLGRCGRRTDGMRWGECVDLELGNLSTGNMKIKRRWD